MPSQDYNGGLRGILVATLEIKIFFERQQYFCNSPSQTQSLIKSLVTGKGRGGREAVLSALVGAKSPQAPNLGLLA